MKSALIGNGVAIQFGGTAYLNGNIIQRAIDNVRLGNFPDHLYPKECADFVKQLQREHRKALNGEYDRYVFTTYDRASLADFKARYETGREYDITEIGFEIEGVGPRKHKVTCLIYIIKHGILPIFSP